VQIKPYRIHGGWPPVPLRLYDRVLRLWGDVATTSWMASRFIPSKRDPLGRGGTAPPRSTL